MYTSSVASARRTTQPAYRLCCLYPWLVKLSRRDVLDLDRSTDGNLTCVVVWWMEQVHALPAISQWNSIEQQKL